MQKNKEFCLFLITSDISLALLYGETKLKKFNFFYEVLSGVEQLAQWTVHTLAPTNWPISFSDSLRTFQLRSTAIPALEATRSRPRYKIRIWP